MVFSESLLTSHSFDSQVAEKIDWVLGTGCIILFWHSLSLPYNYSISLRVDNYVAFMDYISNNICTKFFVQDFKKITLVLLFFPIVHLSNVTIKTYFTGDHIYNDVTGVTGVPL